MERSEAVKDILKWTKETDVVIASCGYIAREVYHCKDRPLNFYMQGSMGCALGMGIGIALFKDTDVVVIQGDGASLMSFGTIPLMEKLNLPNLHLIILDNNCHESTGGQKTCGLGDYYATKITKGGKVPPRIDLTCKQITERFKNALKSIDDKVKPQIS